MGKIEELIKKKFGGKVEYKKLSEVCEMKKGQSLSKSDKDTGNVPIILYGELYTTYGDYINEIVSFADKDIAEKATKAEKGNLLFPISSTTKEAQIGKASVLNTNYNVYIGGDAVILKHNQNAGYLMYVINSSWFEKEKMKCVYGTTIMHLHPKEMMEIKIPVPPIKVQEEIVKILDSFTELTAELTARKKQYEYYRDLILSFDKERYEEEIAKQKVNNSKQASK